MIAHHFQISHFWKSIWLSKSFLIPLVYGFKIIIIDSHILFSPFFLPPVSFVHNSNKINSLFFSPNDAAKVNTSAEKAWSKNLFHLAMLFIHVRLQSSCHSGEQPVFLWAIYQKWHHQKMFWWPGMSKRQRALFAESRAHQHLHPCAVTEWLPGMLKAELCPSSLLGTR